MKLLPVIPFEPIRTEKIPKGDGWISQVKWDGVRMLVYFDGEYVKLYNRKKHERTMQYPELTDMRRYCQANSVILDGEIIALVDGKPSFHQVMKRDSVRKESSIQIVKDSVPITYMVFDLLYANGNWLTNRSLCERQQMLSELIKVDEVVQLVKNHNDSEALFKAVSDHGLEGIVMKDLNSTYAINGKDKRWQKRKIVHDLIAVVGGVTHRSGIVNALLLGLYDEKGRLWYIGHAGSGKLTVQDWRELTETVKRIRIPDCPFVNTPERRKDAVWIKPELTVKINFLEWTQDNSLRQPSIQSFVNADLKECTFGQI